MQMLALVELQLRTSAVLFFFAGGARNDPSPARTIETYENRNGPSIALGTRARIPER